MQEIDCDSPTHQAYPQQPKLRCALLRAMRTQCKPANCEHTYPTELEHHVWEYIFERVQAAVWCVLVPRHVVRMNSVARSSV